MNDRGIRDEDPLAAPEPPAPSGPPGPPAPPAPPKPQTYVAAVEPDPDYEWSMTRKKKRKRDRPKPEDGRQGLLFEVRPPAGWFKVYNALTESELGKSLSKTAERVYLDLCRRRSNDSGLADPSVEEVADRLGLDDSNVAKAMKLLREMRLIHLERGRSGWTGRRCWSFPPPEQWRPAKSVAPTTTNSVAPTTTNSVAPTTTNTVAPAANSLVPLATNMVAPAASALYPRLDLIRLENSDSSSSKTADGSAAAAAAAVREALAAVGFDDAAVAQVAALPSCTLDQIRIAIARADYAEARARARGAVADFNRRGYLRRAIEQRYQPLAGSAELRRNRMPESSAEVDAAAAEARAATDADELRWQREIAALSDDCVEALAQRALARMHENQAAAMRRMPNRRGLAWLTFLRDELLLERQGGPSAAVGAGGQPS